MSTEDTITQAELAEALRGLKITPEDENTFYPAVADAIFAKVRRNREPEYEPGGWYRCARGDAWQFTRSGEWEAFGVSGSVPFTVPERPLCKLVPSWAGQAMPTYRDILAAVADGMEREEDVTDLAQRVHKLIGGQM